MGNQIQGGSVIDGSYLGEDDYAWFTLNYQMKKKTVFGFTMFYLILMNGNFEGCRANKRRLRNVY